MAGSFPHLRGRGVARRSQSLSSLSQSSVLGREDGSRREEEGEDIEAYLLAFQKGTKNKGHIDWAKLMESPPPLVSDIMGGASNGHSLPKDRTFLKPSGERVESAPVDSPLNQLSGRPPTPRTAGGSRAAVPSVAVSHHLMLRSSEMLSVVPSVQSLNTNTSRTVTTRDSFQEVYRKGSLETESGDSDSENGFLANVKMADEFLLTSDEEEGALVPAGVGRTLDRRDVHITQHFMRRNTGSREQFPSPTPSPPTVTSTTDGSSLPQNLKEHIRSKNHLELAGSPSCDLAARGKVRKLTGKKLNTELDSPEVTITESPATSTSLPRFPNVHVHTLEELGQLTSSEGSQTLPGQQGDCSDIAHTQSASHSGLRAASPQTTRDHHFNFSASMRTVPVDLQSVSKIQQPCFESVLSLSHTEDVTGYSDDGDFESEAVSDESAGESTREGEVMEELSDDETHGEAEEEEREEEEAEREKEERKEEEREGEEQGEDEDRSVSTDSIEVDVTGRSKSPLPNTGDSDTESMAHEHSSIQYPQSLAHSTSPSPQQVAGPKSDSISPTDIVNGGKAAASKDRGTPPRAGQRTAASKAGRTGTAQMQTLGSQDASVQTTLPDVLESVGGHLGSRDPTPVAPHAVSQEALAYSPAMIALDDMLRAQLLLTQQFITSTRRIRESLSVSLQPDYHYTTLEDTKEYIARHRPKVLTREEAKELVRRREEHRN